MDYFFIYTNGETSCSETNIDTVSMMSIAYPEKQDTILFMDIKRNEARFVNVKNQLQLIYQKDYILLFPFILNYINKDVWEMMKHAHMV